MTDLQAKMDALYHRKVEQKLEQAVRFCALSIATNLKMTTPVDTGRARDNWHMDLNTVEVRLVNPNEGQSSDEKSGIVARYKLGGTLFISNNLPYIKRLNEGWSQQAPAGFVDDAILKSKSQTEQRFR